MSLHSEPTADDLQDLNLRDDAARRCLSAAVDGEGHEIDAACRAWRDDPEARATWHRYHLIGDVLRSQELAVEPAQDAAFMARLRDRLAAEPVVLAPQPLPAIKPAAASSRSASRWLVPAAAAAGFVAVAGVLVVSRLSTPDGSAAGAILATAPASSSAVATVGVSVPAASPRVQGDAGLLRDARLDEYLRAHQAARGVMPMAVPGGGLRRVDAEMQPGAAR